MSHDPEEHPSNERPQENPRPNIADYELIRRIGRGSYGEVWLGRGATGSFHAIKVVFRASFDGMRPYEREFAGIKTFEPISRSHHAQIDILHVGRDEEDRYFYYVMELADDASCEQADRDSGNAQSSVPPSTESNSESRTQRTIHPESYVPKTLKSLQNSTGSLAASDCLSISISLSEALEHLHSQGLVHRDIKPSNVIFINGRPKLADIGLVAQADATVSFVGTEGYLPPEGPGRPQADIYSLGKVIYEMVTGRDRNEFPQPPSGIENSKEHDAFLELNEIILKACENQVGSRYASATELLRDLQILDAGNSVRWRNRVSSVFRKSLKFAAQLTAAVLVLHLGIKAYQSPPRESVVLASTTIPIPAEFDLSAIKADLRYRQFDYSRDGKRILFADSQGDLFLYENESLRQLYKDRSREWVFRTVAWREDGDTFAAAAYRRADLSPNRNVIELDRTIFVGNATENPLSEIPASFAGNVIALMWRPNADGLVLRVKQKRETQTSQTWNMDLSGEIRPWPDSDIAQLVNSASEYSPSGTWISGGDHKDVWLIRSDGKDAVQLTSHPQLIETHPAWLDEETLIYVRYESPLSAQSARLMRVSIDRDTGEAVGEPFPTPLIRWSQVLYPRAVGEKGVITFLEKQTVEWIRICDYPAETNSRTLGQGGSLRLSADGQEAYYIDRTPDREGIYARASLPGSEPRPVILSSGIPPGGFDVSPREDLLAYTHLDETGRFVVEIVGTLGKAPTRIRNAEENILISNGSGPRWSPDGDWIAIETDSSHVSIVDPISAMAERNLSLRGTMMDGVESLFWSPSGKHLAFIIASEGFHVDVYSLPDGIWKRLASEDYIEMLSWRPHSEGGELTYFTYDYPNCHHSVFINDDSVNHLLPVRPSVSASAPGELDFWGFWGPFGDRFYFSSDQHENSSVHVYDARSGRVEHEAVPGFPPVWSHDGSTMGWLDGESRRELKWMDLR